MKRGLAGRGIPNRVAIGMAKSMARVAPSWSAGHLRHPAFIIGCARSGTTVLHTTLATHKEIAAYPLEANELWHPRAYPWFRSRLALPPMWADPHGYTAISSGQRTEADERFLRATFGAYQLISGGSRFLNKTVTVMFMLPTVLELFPDARFIHAVRDGRPVALSHATKHLIQVRALPEAREAYRRARLDLDLHDLVTRFGRYWTKVMTEVETQRKALRLDERGLLLEIRYEDLCEAPGSQLEAIADFLRVDPRGFRVEAALKNMNFKAERELGPERFEALTRSMEDGLRLKAYL